jgi:hypothetical protein
MDFKKLRSEIRKEDGRRLNKLDYILLAILLTIYSLFAFLNLGSLRAPQTLWKADPGATVIVDLGETRDVTAISFFGGIGNGDIAIYDESSFGEEYFEPERTEPLEVFTQEQGDMFRWEKASVYAQAQYLVLYVESGHVEINEIAVLNGSELLPATVYHPQGGAERLLDEQSTVTTEPSYLDGMYFDEIYHARTAYESVKNDDLLRSEGLETAARDGYTIYETTHPTLGKLFIALGVRMFGMTPFGWRFAGTFFGVLILAVLYVFGKRIFRRTDFAFVTAALFAADGMHFAQTRIATIDTYALFFTLLMFLFMGDYIAEDFEKRPYWKKIALLGLSGLMFGLGVSSKWTCLYSGGGLAVLYFGDLIYNAVRILKRHFKTSKEDRKKLPVNVIAYLPVLFTLVVTGMHIGGKWCNWAEYRKMKYIDGKAIWVLDAERVGVDTIRKVLFAKWFWVTLLVLVGIAIVSAVVFRLVLRNRKNVDLSLNNVLMTPVWCCLFFIVIPIVLYVATNYCYYITDNCRTLADAMKTLWEKQISMYRYHADLDATHLCQSMWYQWPLAQKAVWFYSGGATLDDGTKLVATISSTGNPAVWYISAFGAILAAAAWFKNRAWKKDRAFIVVFVGILAGLLPWALVTRCVFLYHYFSTIPFMMLLTLLLFFHVERKYPRTGWLKWAWLIAAVIVFLLMLPAVSGFLVPNVYAKFIENVLTPFGKVYYVGL